MQKERTFVMIKPDGVQRGFIGEIIRRFERKGIKIVAMKLVSVDRKLAEKHYGIHKGKPFFEPTVKYITSSPVVALVLEGINVIEMVRGMTGATDPQKAAPGTIRGDYATMEEIPDNMAVWHNIIHASEDAQSAREELYYFKVKHEITCSSSS